MRTKKGKRLTGVVLATLLVLTTASVVQAIPPDPDNAALLYYQALLIHHKPDKDVTETYDKFVSGEAELTDEIEKYIEGSHAALDYALMGAQVKSCDWGLPYSKGFSMLLSHMSQLRSLSYLLIADARLQAARGNEELALKRCLAIQRFAQHVGDDTVISYLVSVAMRDVGCRCMRDIIGQASDDAALLCWLKKELAKSRGREISPIRPLEIDREIVMELLRMDSIGKLANVLADFDENEIKARASEEEFARARQLYSERIRALLAILGASMPYKEGHARLKQLETPADTDDSVAWLTEIFTPPLAKILTVKMRSEMYANVTRAGVEVCLQKARSGQLPSTLPANAPKDPFSGQAFEYERTDDGFILRCRAKDLDKDILHEYAFTLK